MTCATVCSWLEVELLGDFFSELTTVLLWVKPHGRDLVERTKVWVWVAVTFQAPLHGESFGLVDLFHLIDAPVTTFTTDPASHVGAVIEVHVIGQIVNSYPLDGNVLRVGLTNRQQLGAIGVNACVAIHARASGWNG